MTKELQRHYKTLRIKPGASAEDVRQAYEYLAGAWDVERFADNPEWRKRAEVKLAEIKTAYEEILDAMNRGEEDLMSDDPGQTTGKEKDGALTKKTIFYFLALASAAALIVIGIFIWPTADDRGGNAPAEKKQIIRTEHPDDRASEKKPAPPPGRETVKTEKVEKTEAAKPPARPVGSKMTGPPAAAQVEKKPYSVQITALRDAGRAESLTNQLKKSGWEAHIARADLKGQGVIHRVLVGHFATKEEAIRFMMDKKIKDTYPGSFIQKTTP